MAEGDESVKTPTTAEMLAAVKRALFEIATGKVKTFALGTRSLTFHNLGELRALKRELEQELTDEHTSPDLLSGAKVAYFDRP